MGGFDRSTVGVFGGGTGAGGDGGVAMTGAGGGFGGGGGRAIRSIPTSEAAAAYGARSGGGGSRFGGGGGSDESDASSHHKASTIAVPMVTGSPRASSAASSYAIASTPAPRIDVTTATSEELGAIVTEALARAKKANQEMEKALNQYRDTIGLPPLPSVYEASAVAARSNSHERDGRK
jgi:hypothetical protein